MNQRFKEYAEEATKGIPGLSVSEREQETEEIRQHLETLAQQHLAEGMAEAEAVEAAIHAFGSPQQVRQGFRRVYGKQILRFIRSYLFGVDSVPMALVVALLAAGIANIPGNMLSHWLSPGTADSILPSLLCSLVLSTIAWTLGGLAAGWVAPRRAPWSMALITLSMVYRCWIELIVIVKDYPSPRFWAPFLTTVFCLVTVPIALFWACTYSRKIRLRATNQ